MLLVAQIPQGISYQAVAYDANGLEISNQEIYIRLGILLETADAETSYTETHQVSTNDFGLFSLVISEGNSTDDFSSLNWENGAFLKIELDTNLDGDYTLMGLSSFNAVPYALYAPVHSDIASQLDSQSNQLEFYTTSLQELLNNGKTPKQIVNQGVEKERLYGLSYEGGYIFHLSESLDQGMVFSKEELGIAIWGCENELIGANGIDVGYGYYNTQIILNSCIYPDIAAGRCVTYEFDSYNDWFLPSASELDLLQQYFSNKGYWSSSEKSVNSADHSTQGQSNKSFTNFVLAIRAFGDNIYGCIDPLSCNYDSSSYIQDLSCQYPISGYDCNDINIYSIIENQSISQMIESVSDINLLYGLSAFGGLISNIDTINRRIYIISDVNIGSLSFGCNTEFIGVFSTEMGSGSINSNLLANYCSGVSTAINWTDGEFNDWYLPSLDELIISFSNLYRINSILENPFLSGIHLSSTEASSSQTYVVGFSSPTSIHRWSKTASITTRVIRHIEY